METEAKSSSVTVSDALQRFSRLKRIGESTWKSPELELMAQFFGNNLAVDEVSSNRVFALLSLLETKGIRDSTPPNFGLSYKQSQHCALRAFLKFCYESGFSRQNLRPILEIDSQQLAKLKSHPMQLPARIDYVSAQGLKRLEGELEYLLTDQRPRIARWLSHAAPDSGPGRPAFDMPKEAQSMVEGRIADLQLLLRNVVVIETARPGFLFSECVNIGDVVRIQVFGESEIETYTIVGSHEANPSKGWISFYSPLGRALIGYLAGDTLTVRVPSGNLVVTILETERGEIVYDEPLNLVDYVRYTA